MLCTGQLHGVMMLVSGKCREFLIEGCHLVAHLMLSALGRIAVYLTRLLRTLCALLMRVVDGYRSEGL